MNERYEVESKRTANKQYHDIEIVKEDVMKRIQNTAEEYVIVRDKNVIRYKPCDDVIIHYSVIKDKFMKIK
jgi:hypothetical protein